MTGLRKTWHQGCPTLTDLCARSASHVLTANKVLDETNVVNSSAVLLIPERSQARKHELGNNKAQQQGTTTRNNKARASCSCMLMMTKVSPASLKSDPGKELGSTTFF